MTVAIGPVNSTADNIIDHGMWPSDEWFRAPVSQIWFIETGNRKPKIRNGTRIGAKEG